MVIAKPTETARAVNNFVVRKILVSKYPGISITKKDNISKIIYQRNTALFI